MYLVFFLPLFEKEKTFSNYVNMRYIFDRYNQLIILTNQENGPLTINLYAFCL